MKRIITLLSLLLLIICSVNAQEEYKHRYAGIGYRLNTFTVSELTFNMPVNRLMVNIDPIKYVRLDFQYGFYKYLDNVQISVPNGGYESGKMEDKSSVYSIGLMGQYRFDDMSVYGGIRYGMLKESFENYYVDYPWPYTNYSIVYYTNTNEIKTLSPVIGGEYRFGNRFSVGAEASFLFSTYHYKSGSPYQTGQTMPDDKLNMLETAAFFRFYIY